MKGINVLTMALFLLVFAYPAEAAAQPPSDKLSEIMKRGKIIIAVEENYPPQSNLIKGVKRSSDTKCFSHEYTAAEFRGFETDVAKEFAKRLGVEPCFLVSVWSETINGRWANRFDIAFESVSLTSERTESLYFAQPYNSEPTAFYVHKDNTKFKQPADLSGKKIGVCSGCTFEYYLEQTLKLPGEKVEYFIKNPDIIAYDVESKSFADLAGMKIDAVLTAVIIGSRAISDGKPVRQLGEPVFYSYIAPAIDKKQSTNPIPFIRKISEIIRAMHKDGTLEKLSMQYYGSDFSKQASKFDIEALGQFR